MKSICLALLGAWLPAAAHAAEPPLRINVAQALAHFRASAAADAQADIPRGTAGLLAELAEEPGSPYTDAQAYPRMLNAEWWPDFVQQVAPHLADGDQQLVESLVRQVGLTKARPGIDVMVSDQDAAIFRGTEAAANAIKAGIDPDIYWRARDLSGSRITVAAMEAVALQRLREAMVALPEDQWEARGIRRDVFTRYMQAVSPADLTTDDERYLAAVLLQDTLAGASPSAPGHGYPLGVPLRIARVAASYKDALGYFGGSLCQGTQPSPGMPRDMSAFQDHRPLCFIAATDRAVHAWYRREARLEHARIRIHDRQTSGVARALALLGAVMPLLDVAALVEFEEALWTDQAWSEAAADEEGSAVGRLMCRVRA
jgi:hypothetical protein